MREWPVPKRWTKPPAPIASAQTSLARSMASACVSRIFSRIPIPASIHSEPAFISSAHHLGVDLHRFPVAALHGLVGGVQHRVHDVSVDEVLAWLLALDVAIDEVAHLLVVAVHARFIGNREDPADVRVRLLHQVAGGLLDESLHASRAGVRDDAPHRAVYLV